MQFKLFIFRYFYFIISSLILCSYNEKIEHGLSIFYLQRQIFIDKFLFQQIWFLFLSYIVVLELSLVLYSSLSVNKNKIISITLIYQFYLFKYIFSIFLISIFKWEVYRSNLVIYRYIFIYTSPAELFCPNEQLNSHFTSHLKPICYPETKYFLDNRNWNNKTRLRGYLLLKI